MIGGGSSLGGVFGGLVVNATSDWRWIFWMCTILNGVCFFLILFFYEETNFARPLDAEAGDDTDSLHEVPKSSYSFVSSLSLFRWYDR